ncbi:hypothetical protein U3A55_02455 [Salarchaeum sp. III]|uniref:hypothetical protein n=1 Tax=Salarchaeum sp. III TaxID=3107927 RepID=UPI002ED8A80D
MKCPTCGISVSKRNLTCHSCEAELPRTAEQEMAATAESGGGGGGKIFPILGWVFAILSLFVIPILFGIAGIVMGVFTIKRRSKIHGIIIIIASIVLMILGSVISALMMMV